MMDIARIVWWSAFVLLVVLYPFFLLYVWLRDGRQAALPFVRQRPFPRPPRNWLPDNLRRPVDGIQVRRPE
jgi:hypothetical protein